MHKSATKCNETLSKWCKNKHRASKIIDTFETYQPPPSTGGFLWRRRGETGGGEAGLLGDGGGDVSQDKLGNPKRKV
jgi:hypothetical protein